MKKEIEPALTENVVIRVSPKEKALLDKYARKEGWSISEYVRATMLADMAMMQGDTEAMKIIFHAAREKLVRRFNKKFRPLQQEAEN